MLTSFIGLFVPPEVSIAGLSGSDKLTILRGCPGTAGAPGPKGEPGTAGLKGRFPGAKYLLRK